MPDESHKATSAEWTRAIDVSGVQPGSPVAVKLAGKHVSLFSHGGEILACNNRCPHEGYPLVEGALDAECRLTCHWHNWKFDLRTGANEYGGDNLRTYPVKVDNGFVWLDLSDPPAEVRIARALSAIDEAMLDVDAPRLAREIARLAKAGASPERALSHAIDASNARLRYGMTHAYAGAEAWFRLRDRLTGETERLACATEALVHISHDVRGEPPAPYASECIQWAATTFLAAIEAQDEAQAIAQVNGALDEGLRFVDLEPALTSAALAHYADFGHSLIYLTHVRRLIDRLGRDTERPLLHSWVRSLVYATREDLLPDFQGYANALHEWPRAAARKPAAPSSPMPSAALFEGTSIREALAAALEIAAFPPLIIYHALFDAAARQLLRFDETHALAADNPVSDNVGWLDFSHALTFAHALREQCMRLPEQEGGLWPRGLLQLALFVGRNKSYLAAALDSRSELERWSVADEPEFHRRAIATIVDHGVGLPIFPVHWLKTWTAVRDEVAIGLSPSARLAGLAAVNRLLAVRFKQRHPLRNAHQALGFVAREG
jgi:nitrite reductase/ring-hydroxylating ferredoxin subunit